MCWGGEAGWSGGVLCCAVLCGVSSRGTESSWSLISLALSGRNRTITLMFSKVPVVWGRPGAGCDGGRGACRLGGGWGLDRWLLTFGFAFDFDFVLPLPLLFRLAISSRLRFATSSPKLSFFFLLKMFMFQEFRVVKRDQCTAKD